MSLNLLRCFLSKFILLYIFKFSAGPDFVSLVQLITPTTKNMYFLQEQIKPFKRENLPQDSGNPSVPLRATKKKENAQRQAWPHQKLREIKKRNPKKKQNALLENIDFLTTYTQSSATSLQCKDSPHIEDVTSREEFITPKQNKPLTSRNSVNLHSQDLRSNIVEKSESITQAKNASKDHVSTHDATEGSEPPQSIRSTSSSGSKSKVMSKKPPTKTLHLGEYMACFM